MKFNLKKGTKIILIASLLPLILWINLVIIDFVRVENGHIPTFTKRVTRDNGEIVYYGLGYKVTQFAYTEEELVTGVVAVEYRFLFFKKDYFAIGSSSIGEVKFRQFNIEEKDNCTYEKELYYTDAEGVNYYISCLEKFETHFKLDLKVLFEKEQLTFEQLINKSKDEPVLYKDGGSKLYKFDDFAILECHAMTDFDENEEMTYNTDIIIGKKDIDINDGYCKN